MRCVLALVVAPASALILGAGSTVSVSRASSVTMRWDPKNDGAGSNDKAMGGQMKSHMLQHSEECTPMYVPEGPGYVAPEDGCEQVVLDQYASMVFGGNAKKEAWICADEAEDSNFGECNFVMHNGAVVKACI